MLYDPRWEKTIKAEPSLAGLIAWLETQDPATTYRWAGGCEPCLIAQYVATLGIPREELFRPDERGETLYERLSINNGCLAAITPHTFGAALERARAAITSTNGTKS